MKPGPLLAGLRRRALAARIGWTGAPQPFGGAWGYDRGLPVDRWYIDRFLEQHRADITGRVLEVKDSGYTDRFGHAVTERAVLDVDAANPHVTHVADLAAGDGLPSAAFECFVLTQTLQYVFDVGAALATAHRLLTPGGVVLATLPVTSRITEPPLTDLWRFTPLAATRLFSEAFGADNVTAHGHGNVRTQIAFLDGLAAEDLDVGVLEEDDPRFPLVVCVRAVKDA